MRELERVRDQVIQRTNIHLRGLDSRVDPGINRFIPSDRLSDRAVYGFTANHPVSFHVSRSSLSGSYILGRCDISDSLLYRSDVRGDELKRKGETFTFQEETIPIRRDEVIDIQDSLLIETLVHNFSHDPETPERFYIRDTVSSRFANIHGSPSRGCFLEPFSTVDLTTMNGCLIGAFSYIQVGKIDHQIVKPGTVWVQSSDEFNFLYHFPVDVLREYIGYPQGVLMAFSHRYEKDVRFTSETGRGERSITVPGTSSLDRYAVTRSDVHIGENVLVSQRAFLRNAWLGDGANAQENCFIINSRLEGLNVTAHGAKIIEADLGEKVFVGFNSFLRGRANERSNSRLSIGKGSVVMPHTIIDIEDDLRIPDDHLVWGVIKSGEDLAVNSMPIEEFERIDSGTSKGGLIFEGSGSAFIRSFSDRIHHILEANGAFFSGKPKGMGHAQKNRALSSTILHPYSDGDDEGLFPTTTVRY